MNTPMLDQLFDNRITLPDLPARDRLARLVGMDDEIESLAKLLGVLIYPSRLDKWAEKYHKNAPTILAHVKRRHPLVIIAGDVGTGKTELAETIGDRVARQEKIKITLYPMSLSARGSGLVGEMTRLISSAFDHVVEDVKKITRKKTGEYVAGAILLIDEADAIAQSRENSQMHHEDKAGVNALIRGLDLIRRDSMPAAVIMCTNRLSAVDPAVRRRAANIFCFRRPNIEQRKFVFTESFKGIGFTDEQINQLVKLSGKSKEKPAFTFSDITERFMYAVVMDAYPDKAIEFERAEEMLENMEPTPPFTEET